MKKFRTIFACFCAICMLIGSFGNFNYLVRAEETATGGTLEEAATEEVVTEPASEPTPAPVAEPTTEAPVSEPVTTEPQTEAPVVTEPAADQEHTLIKELTASDGRKYNISVSYKADSNIPEGAELLVSEVRDPQSYTEAEKEWLKRPEEQKTDEEKRAEEVNAHYNDYMEKGAAVLKEKAEDLTFAIAFDIKLKDPVTKVEYQPNEDVQVMVQLEDIELKQDAKIDIVHFDESKKSEEAEKAKKLQKEIDAGNKKVKEEQKEAALFAKIGKPEQVETETEQNTAKFDTDGFSVYVVTAKTQEQKLYASDGATYNITATYDYTASIPKDAQLAAVEILPGDEAYDAYLAETLKTVGASPEELTYAKPLDIFFLDPETGAHIKPDKNVAIRIDLFDAAPGEAESVNVVHFGEKAEAVEANVSENAVSFASDEFSVFVIVFTADIEGGEDPEPQPQHYDYYLFGSDSVLLSELLTQLAIPELAVGNVSGVTSSEEEGLKVTHVPAEPGAPEDWIIEVTESFTEGNLTLTLNDESTVVITVKKETAHNAKITITEHQYDPDEKTITYTAVVEAEGDLDNHGVEYPVAISLTEDASRFVEGSGSYTYEHTKEDPPEGSPASLINGSEDLTGDLSSASVSAAHMYDGDKLTLTYTLKAEPAEYIGDGEAQVNYTVSLTNSDNPFNDPADDTASVTTEFEHKLVTKSCTNLDGSWATWKLEVNPDGITLNDNNPLILKDSFNIDDPSYDGEQSIDYSSIVTDPAAEITYDYSGSTGTFVIPDSTKVTITYRARVKAQPGDSKDFGGSFLLQKEAGGETTTIEEGFAYKHGTIYPSASDAAAMTGEYFVKMFVYADGQMQTGIEGAEFILMDANKRPILYDPTDVDTAIRFTTGADGYVEIRPDRAQGFALEKNTAYYLEMTTAPAGYKKDNTMYSFMITDDPSYNSGGIYTYYNGDTMKVRVYPEAPGLNVSIRFSGNYTLTEQQANDINVILQKETGTDTWVDLESHLYSEFSYGSYAFATPLNAGETYRVIQEDWVPPGLDPSIHPSIAYYLVKGNDPSHAPESEPIDFMLTESEAAGSVNAVMNNEYEEHKLTITKMDKLTGEILSGATFEVKEADGDRFVKRYTTDASGVIEIAGGGSFRSDTLYYVEETDAPDGYLLPITPKRFYFYFCDDPELEPGIKELLPQGVTAVNLLETYDSVSLDNQEETVSIPVMATWQDGEWPGTEDKPVSVTIGLYQSVDGGEPEQVKDGDDQPLQVILTKGAAYNNTAFTDLPVRTEANKPITYSIKEEDIMQDGIPLLSTYVQEYGISDSGVYIVRNRKAATLTINKEWYSNGEKVEAPDTLAQQSDVTFDVYRSTEMIPDEIQEGGITNAEMADIVSTLTKVRSNLTFGNTQDWTMDIPDLVKKEDGTDKPYHYYVFENVPSFGNETYEIAYATETENEVVTIKNPVAPPRVDLTVAKAALEDDPRPESADTEFTFTLLLKKGDHVIRNYTVYTDEQQPENTLTTNWDGEVTFTLKPEHRKVLSLPAGVTATITETPNREYHETSKSSLDEDETIEHGNVYTYDTVAEQDVTVTYTNTLHVFCKVVDSNEVEHPFESLKSALDYIHDKEEETCIHDGFAKIEMIEDYEMPPKDVFALAAGEKVILTRAMTVAEAEAAGKSIRFPFKTDRVTDTDKAIITRVDGGDTLLENAGILTIEKLIIDGGCTIGAEDGSTVEGDGGIVYNTGTLNLNAGTVLRNSSVSGKGGAIYSSGTINMKEGAVISGNTAKSGSAIYLEEGTLNMTGGVIHMNKVEDDGAVAIENQEVQVNLSGNVKINTNTDTSDEPANLYLGADSDHVITVVDSGLGDEANIWVKPMQGHREIGEQFATADSGAGENNLEKFVNDLYEYRGKLRDGTDTNIVWNGLDLTLNKIVPTEGANPNDRFRITLSSMSIRKTDYVIEGTVDYEVKQAGQNPGTIIFTNVKAGERYKIKGLPVGVYTLSEDASNYEPTYAGVDEAEQSIIIRDGGFTMNGNSTVTVTNTRKTADINLTKTLQDKLVGTNAVDFPFEITLKDPDGTAIKGFTLKKADTEAGTAAIVTNDDGKATLTMSPTNASAALQNIKAPVGSIMTIKETAPDYRISFEAKTPAGEAISDKDEESADTFVFDVAEDGANIGISNVRKMATIQLTNNLVNKVSTAEAFDLTVTLLDGEGQPAANYTMYEDTDDPENNITTDGDGKAVLSCTFPKNVTSIGFELEIPEGTNLTVEETASGAVTDLSNYDTTYAVNGAASQTGKKAVIGSVKETDSSIIFTNTRKLRTVTVTNTVKGYSGNTRSFAYSAVVSDGGESDYDVNGFSDGEMTFELATGQNRQLVVPYGAELTVEETFVVGYETTVQHGDDAAVVANKDEFSISENVTVAFTNNQMVGLAIVNNTSDPLGNVQVYIEKKTKVYKVNEDQTDQTPVTLTNKWATFETIAPGEKLLLEVEHEYGEGYIQKYTVKGNAPELGYYYTIINEPSYHEYADPAIQRVYNKSPYEVSGQLRFGGLDSTVTFTEQPLVSFDANGGVWTTEMEGYHDRDGDRQVYQYAVNKGETVSEPAPAPIYPTEEGITFLGWTADETYAKADHSDGQVDLSKRYDFSAPVSAPVTLFAIWKKAPSDRRTVTVENSVTSDLTITATLTQDGTPVQNYQMTDGVVTDGSGAANFQLPAGEFKNLKVPDGAKLVLAASGADCIEYSSIYTDADSVAKSFTIDSVKRDGTVSFIAGICKITDSAGNVLYDSNGQAAVYGTLAAAFTAYNATLYTDASHTTVASQAAVKMLIDEYAISSKHAFPTKNVIVTTADKNDADFPYVGMRDRATLYRAASFTGDTLFALQNTARDVTLTEIILDGRNVGVVKTINGGLIYMNQAGSALNITTGATLRNVVFAAYDDGNNARGGAIYINNGTLNVDAGLFSNLKARRGGAINAEGNAILNITGEDGSTRFEDCTTDSNNVNNAGGDGGAVYYGSSQPLTIDGGTATDADSEIIAGIIFDRCKALTKFGDGGAICADTSYNNDVTIIGCEFNECSSEVTSGHDGISNTTGNGGGAIAAYHVKGLKVQNCAFNSCDTMVCGGAIVAMVKTVTGTIPDDEGTITIDNCDFDKCNCKAQGGSVAVYQDNNGSTGSTTRLLINSSSFTNSSSGTDNGSGGAIQSYIPCLQFVETTFIDCWAGKEGGAVNNWYGSNDAQMWTNASVIMDNCNFIRCRAEDRYKLDDKVHFGGGIATKARTLVVTDSYFEDCVSTLKQGGAIHCSGIGSGSSATVTGSIFKGCMAKDNGGGITANNETLTVEDSFFYGCSSFAENGGAIYHGNSVNSMTQLTTTITECTFSDLTDADNTYAGCSAAKDGGAIWTKASTATIENCSLTKCTAGINGGAIRTEAPTVNVNNCTVSECEASGNGGGMYFGKEYASTTISGGSITGGHAVNGSAVYVYNNVSVTFSGNATITGNEVSSMNSAAVQGGGNGSKLFFEGNVKVEDNTCSADAVYDHDVLMQRNDNNDANMTIVQTTSNGLGVQAHVGIYVPDNIFNRRGIEGMVFGKFGGDQGNNYLDNFFNDRNDMLFGYQASTGNNYIYWGKIICKITDADGRTLLRADSRRYAVYQKLSMAFSDFSTNSFTYDEDQSYASATPACIKMIIESYDLPDTATINVPASQAITLTTAGKQEIDGLYEYEGEDYSIINRGKSTTSLFTVQNGATFTLTNITLDGGAVFTDEGAYSSGSRPTVDGGLINTAAAATIHINSGATLQNSAITNGKGGAAVFLNNANSSFYMDGGVIRNCLSGSRGGAAVSSHGTGSVTVLSGRFENCNTLSGWGGAIFCKANQVKIGREDKDYTIFINCKTEGSCGGAISHQHGTANNESNVEITHVQFINCTQEKNDNNQGGGALYTNAKTISVTDSIFTDCWAKNNGGAISVRDNGIAESLTISGCTFTNCESENRSGGAIYSAVKTLTVQDNAGTRTVMNSCRSLNEGGAIRFEKASGTVNLTKVDFIDCYSRSTNQYGLGGGLFTKEITTVNVSDSKFEGCKAGSQSGAIHVDASGSSLNINDKTVISKCYAKQGGAIYLKSGVTMSISGRPEFSFNGYTTLNDENVDAEKGACIYLAEGSKLNISGSPVFDRNILPYPDEWVVSGGERIRPRQDIYLAGYSGTNAASLNISGEITPRTGDDMIWVWPEQSPHKLPGQQFATTAANVSEASLNRFRNALADSVTGCSNFEYLAGVRLGTDTSKAYWSKMYSVSFRKIDDKAVGVPGAGFTLYRDAACTDAVATAESSERASDKGNVLFNSIPMGAYYLVETNVPESFGKEEGVEKYLVLVGTPMLSPSDSSEDIWHHGGPLDGVENAETLIPRNTVDAGKYYGIYPIIETTGKADVKTNRASGTSGVKNLRIDFEVYFMKVDGSGAALPNASFSVFSQTTDEQGRDTYDNGYPILEPWSRDGEHFPVATSADGSASYKDRNGTILPPGLVYFAELPIGTYYLLETAYPERNGSRQRTSYVETDRLLQLVIRRDESEKTVFELKEWMEEPDPETSEQYKEVSRETVKKSYNDEYCYQIANIEAVCKLTDNAGNLLYTLGHDGKTTLPAVYPTLEEGFGAAKAGTLVNAGGRTVVDEDTHVPLKLQVLKDFVIGEQIDYNNSARPLTFTTASKDKTATDKFNFVTNRTSDNARAEIKRNYSDENGAMLSIAGANLTLQNINLNGQKGEEFLGRAVHVSPAMDPGTGKMTRAGSLTISTSTLLQNFKTTGDGGAVLVDNGAVLIVDGSSSGRSAIFTGNEAANGGAIFGSAGSVVSVKNAQFTGNKASSNGGAIALDDMTGDTPAEASWENLTFGAEKPSGSGNTAGGNGGGLYIGQRNDITLKNTNFIKNNASGEGGAFYAANNTNTTINTTTTSNYTGITGNTAGGVNGGAINVGTDNAKLYFAGTPIVFNNLSGTDQKNVVLNKDSNEVIHTAASGLTNGVIGVYVPDGSGLYDTHGLPTQPFGTFDDDAKAHADVFYNDRNLALRGEKKADTDPTIYWSDVICKLTDMNDKLLYKDVVIKVGNSINTTVKAPALYPTIQEGFNAAQTDGLYSYNSTKKISDKALQLKMLRDAELSKAITYSKGNGNRELTFTTAETAVSDTMRSVKDSFVFSTERTDALKDFALIKRAESFNNDSMIKASGKNLTLKNITLDSSLPAGETVAVNGGILNVGSSGTTTTISEGATLRNAAVGTRYGGAAYVNNGGKLVMNGGTITGNSAANGGAVYLLNGGQMTQSGGTITGNSAANGGAVYLPQGAKMTMSGGEVTGNTALTQGGAFYLQKGGKMDLSGGTINGNSAATGAGIYLAEGSTLNLSGNPNFGGTGVSGDALVTEINGVPAGNFVLQSGFTDADKNGGKQYPKNGSGQYVARQDIYIAGYTAADGSLNAGSLVLTGNVTSADGSIWVWAERTPHYKMMEQFAKISGSVTSGFTALRNARPDLLTENTTSDYLPGAKGEDPQSLYWGGTIKTRKVILRKVREGSFGPIEGARFNLLKGSTPVVVDGVELNTSVLVSQASGIIWIGELPYGTYYLEETTPTTKRFTLVVGDATPENPTGVQISSP